MIFFVMSGKRPQRPEEARALGLSDLIWDLVEMCWQHDSDKRPTMPFILDRLADARNAGKYDSVFGRADGIDFRSAAQKRSLT